MWKILASAAIGFIAANIVNVIEVIMLGKVMKDVQAMLRDLKREGEKDKWLK